MIEYKEIDYNNIVSHTISTIQIIIIDIINMMWIGPNKHKTVRIENRTQEHDHYKDL